jgi:DNA-binding Lrp family transcriptional regulator
VTAAKRKRLRPGELDDLVLAYIGKHEADGPLTASAVAKGIGRSSDAVANCLRRLTKAKKLRQTKKSPRDYVVRKTRA